MSKQLKGQIEELTLLQNQLLRHELKSQIELPLHVYDFIRTSRVSLRAAINEIEAIKERQAAQKRTDAALLALSMSNYHDARMPMF